MIVLAFFLVVTMSFSMRTSSLDTYRWEPLALDFDIPKERTYGGIAVSSLLANQKLYVVLTTISSRLQHVVLTIRSILNGMVIPTHIYLFLSEEAFLFDRGIPKDSIPLELRYLAASTDIFSIIYTDNIGPHRKLLPILKRFWHEDCAIVTVDDDKVLAKDALFKLISYYIDTKKIAVVGLRTRRIGFSTSRNTTSSLSSSSSSSLSSSTTTSSSLSSTTTTSSHPLRNTDKPSLKEKEKAFISTATQWQWTNYGFCRWPRVQNEKLEMLILPTGTGGILYRPRFFHEIVFDPMLRQLTAYNDDLTFRLATLANHIPVFNGCCEHMDRCNVDGSNSTISDKHYSNVTLATIRARQKIVQMSKLRTGISSSSSSSVDGGSSSINGGSTSSSSSRASDGNSIRSRSQDSRRSLLVTKDKQQQQQQQRHQAVVSRPSSSVDHSRDAAISSQGTSSSSAKTKASSSSSSSSSTATTSTDLYVRNEYRNTDMWKAGIEYLQRKGILNLDNYIQQSYMIQERPECFHTRKGFKDEQKKRKSIDNTQPTAATRAVKGVVAVNDNKYILKNQHRCGLVSQTWLN